ncbi:DEAD/DEAH box helicase [Micromonospora sp. 4G57]|uniref:DEAD/DEAH box helicase n=1 Tax=Micromonospora sicca TaxID=2202420 RepID=A0ABU5JK91_9ACTN|nr:MULTISPECIES: DEAD/DEAH box helicase [unclassified Micromonospora]MDZ5447076.1 DEAD/DEAH box helicase [Micromonospora sp. 4G57]MDZ5493047.1 DEAD/DEAH box helicase [Micromonospora sp. 4G53]
MIPSLAVDDLKGSLVQYLTTAFALADDDVHDVLESFLNDERSGVFRGPYLRVRPGFKPATGAYRRGLDWFPTGFEPFLHQERAWLRLSSKGQQPKPTIVTTGTGSGKTESFLVPVLDHCRRARAQGQTGVKALLLYPMNALADDQARRIDEVLSGDPELRDVTAGIYIGGGRKGGDDEESPASYAREFGSSDLEGDEAISRVLRDRDEIRENPPDVLLTNYKMLDLLLQRGPDLPLWQSRSLRYVVLDEFHTYDGAQGTDVAMLLRRLGAATSLNEESRPLGQITPVATSATLASDGAADAGLGEHSAEADRRKLLDFAKQVFGMEFGPDAVIDEDRLTSEEFCGEINFEDLPFPTPEQLAAVPDPLGNPADLNEVARLTVGIDASDAVELGRLLRSHILVRALLESATQAPLTIAQIAKPFAVHGGGPAWAPSRTDAPKAAFGPALMRLLALVSAARVVDAQGRLRPLLKVEAQLWVREVRRVIRAATHEPHFRWFDDDGPTGDSQPNWLNLAVYRSKDHDAAAEDPDTDTAAPAPAALRCHLPAVYCRHCGQSGWAALSKEAALDWRELKTRPLEIYRAAGRRESRVRWMLRASQHEPEAQHLDAEGRMLLASPTDRTVPVATVVGAIPAGNDDTCPSCGLDDGMRFLGAGTATLASVTITQLFSERHLSVGERKLLAFTDAVQDATHRAGFIAHRSFGFTFRGLLAANLRSDAAVAVHDLALDAAESAVAEHAKPSGKERLASLIPPDLRDNPEILRLLDGEPLTSAMEMLQDRLLFQTQLEFGLRSRLGRTIELTRTAAVDIHIPDPDELIEQLRNAHQRIPGKVMLPADRRAYLGYARGLLERMRLRGAIYHSWLDRYLEQAGARRWPIWGGRPTGMQAFPSGLAAPVFMINGGHGDTEFDALARGRTDTWLTDWAKRNVTGSPDEAAQLNTKAFAVFAEQGLVNTYYASNGATVYALAPSRIQVHSLVHGKAGDDVADHGVRCSECTWRQTVAPGMSLAWEGLPCLRFRCGGRFVRDTRRRAGDDFYRRLYHVDRPGDVLTAEHTGALTKPKRQRVERAFKHRAHPFDPNVLTCTPTLELGIDIGDLSAVLLTSMPPGPAQYAQRIGRAGRATGNAMVVAFVPRRARNQYYLHRPTAMLAGRIVPPACYLDAVEILRRHYLAYLFDRAADRSLWDATAAPSAPMPRWIGELFQSGLDDAGGWLRRLLEVARSRHNVLSAQFIDLFPGMSKDARWAVISFAEGDIDTEVGKAVAAWRRRREELQQRLAAINVAFDAIPIDTTDADRRDDRRSLFAELKAVRRRLDGLVKENSVNALVRLGLLPNYTLHDDPTWLDAALWWKDPDGEFQETQTEYGRSAALGLTELAPGNTFHADGSKFIVDGLDIGTPQRAAYTTWRFCRACGYVLTDSTDVVLQRCPRCKDAGIADPAASQRSVLLPERARARERREDARITDDRDERDQRRYVTATLVDIDPKQPHGLRAWRNADRFFGVEFAREAVIRHLNFGPDGSPGSDFDVAGDTVKAPGFQACETCGAVQGVHPQAYDRQARRIGTRHARWCPQRDLGVHKEKTVTLITAHELRTHALRLLLPFSTTLVPKRAVSFQAALMLGITKYFGGEPDHIRAVMATMPGDDRDTPRQFLVLHDTMPGGTGYLENLADCRAMERVLRLALAHIQSCPCGKEDRQPCHRCLLPFVVSSQHELVSRETAAELLSEILEGWQPEEIDTLADIQIHALADSELERLFVETLRAKADKAQDDAAARDRFSLVPRAGSRGVEFELKLKPVDGPAVQWRMRDHVPQAGAVRSEPDYVLTSDGGVKLAIFLDGYAFHASTDNNEIAADAAKRTSLRDDGTWVWQLTWDDVRAWAGCVEQNIAARAPRPDLLTDKALDTATNHYFITTLKGDSTAGPLDAALANPVEALLAFLENPDPEVWARRAVSLLAGLTSMGKAGAVDRLAIADRLPALIAGEATMPPAAAKTAEAVGLIAASPAGCRIVGIRDNRPRSTGRPDAMAWAVFTCLDDRPTALTDQEHRARWAQWLAWSNLLQFVAGPGRYFEQSALSQTLQIDAHRVPVLASAQAGAPVKPALTGPWADAIDLSSPQVESLLMALAHAQTPPPEIGYELGDEAWPVELAWPSVRIAVVIDEDGDRDNAYRHAGWHIHRADGDAAIAFTDLIHDLEAAHG